LSIRCSLTLAGHIEQCRLALHHAVGLASLRITGEIESARNRLQACIAHVQVDEPTSLAN
jgi:hypothetical protein